MHHQIVRPAGTGHETALVALASALILAAAVLAVGVRPSGSAAPVPAVHQIDARTGLTAAEQGLYADLKAAAVEIAARGHRPAPADLAADLLPPFVADASATARGGHVWTLMEDAHGFAYAGRSHDPAIAGSLVLVFAGRDAEVWVKRAAETPASLDGAALAAAGWKQVTTTFDAGVTR